MEGTGSVPRRGRAQRERGGAQGRAIRVMKGRLGDGGSRPAQILPAIRVLAAALRRHHPPFNSPHAYILSCPPPSVRPIARTVLRPPPRLLVPLPVLRRGRPQCLPRFAISPPPPPRRVLRDSGIMHTLIYPDPTPHSAALYLSTAHPSFLRKSLPPPYVPLVTRRNPLRSRYLIPPRALHNTPSHLTDTSRQSRKASAYAPWTPPRRHSLSQRLASLSRECLASITYPSLARFRCPAAAPPTQ